MNLIEVCLIAFHLYLHSRDFGLVDRFGQIDSSFRSRPITEPLYREVHFVRSEVGRASHVLDTSEELVLFLTYEEVGIAQLLVILLLHPFEGVARLRSKIA